MMLTISVLSLLLLAIQSVYAVPGYTTSANYCAKYPTIVSCLKKTAAATLYCSSVLSIKPKTSTITKTIEPSPRRTTYTVTKTPGSTIYTTVITTVNLPGTQPTLTTTSTETATFTSTTRVTTTQTCLTTGISSAGLGKRASTPTSAANCACFPGTYPSASISAACSCLSLSTLTSTVTTTKSCSTPVISTTTTIIPTTTSTIYTATTITNTVSNPVTVTITTTTTTTSTATATATNLERNGVYFREYYYPNNEFIYHPHYDTDYIQDVIKTPEFDGVLPDVNFQGGSNDNLNYPNQGSVSSANKAVVMQGFFVAPADGVYTFGTSGNVVDNWEVVWLGETAYNWRQADKAYDASRTSEEAVNFTSGSKTLTLSAGDALPITVVWGNGGLAARSSVYVITPDGVQHDTLGEFLVQACRPLER